MRLDMVSFSSLFVFQIQNGKSSLLASPIVIPSYRFAGRSSIEVQSSNRRSRFFAFLIHLSIVLYGGVRLTRFFFMLIALSLA